MWSFCFSASSICLTMKTRLIIAGSSVVCLLASLVVVKLLFPPKFEGGELMKGPFFSYPRYRGVLPAVDFGANGQYSTVFRGFPVGDAWIELELSDKTINDLNSLKAMNTVIAVRLAREDGKTICNASGRLSQISGVTEHQWVLTGNSQNARLWNSDCVDLKLNPH